MIRIGLNESSELKVGITDRGEFFIVRAELIELCGGSNEKIAKYIKENDGAQCEILDNFTFSATIYPKDWRVGRSSGNIIFLDAHDPTFRYRMTQRGVFQLLGTIIDGNVDVITGEGLNGLFTFDGSGGILTIKVFEG